MATKTDPFLAMLENSMPLSDALVRKVANKAKAVDSGIPTFLQRDNNNKLPSDETRQRNTADAYAHKPVVRSIKEQVALDAVKKRPDYADDIDAMVATLIHNGDVRFDVATDQYVAPYYQHRRIALATGKIKKGAW